MYENGTIINLSIAKEGEKMQNKLILLMQREKVTTKKIAELLNITEKQAAYKIKGKSDFKCSEMFKIAAYFDKNIDEIFLAPMYENGTKIQC